MFESNIGLDIGSAYVRAVQVGSGRNQLKITEAAEISLPKGAVVFGEIRNAEMVADALRLLWKQNKFRGRTVTFGIEGQQTMVRQLELPWEPPAIFREALPLRVTGDLPVDPSEMVLDYYPLGERVRHNSLMEDALVVGTLAAAPENAELAISVAKLRARKADFSPFALIRAAHYCNNPGAPVPGAPENGQERPCQAIVDLGAQVTTVILHDHGRPLFVRSVNVGSEGVTRALAEQLQVRVDAAEYFKQRLGLGQVIETPLTPDLANEIPFAAEPVARQIINIMAGTLVQTVRDSIEYYLDATPTTTSVNLINITGGGVLLPGYPERLSAELRAPVQPLTPIAQYGTKGVAEQASALDPKFGTAFGLAVKVGK